MALRSTKSGALCAAVMALSLAAAPARAQGAAEAAAGVFEGLAGVWSGGGTITMSNGAKERIRCRATYVVKRGGDSLSQELRCASDSYRFELLSDVRSNGTSIAGTWSESTRRVGGNITGRAGGGTIQARAEGQTFNALIGVTTRGDRQVVSIESPGSDLSEVSITLTRGPR
jgi:hypothetical protein